jgi:hypothetical protein
MLYVIENEYSGKLENIEIKILEKAKWVIDYTLKESSKKKSIISFKEIKKHRRQ